MSAHRAPPYRRVVSGGVYRRVVGGGVALCLSAALLAGCSGGGGTAGSASPASSTSRSRSVPVKVVTHGGQTIVLLRVSIHGSGPYLFVLDTGASSSAVDKSLAQRLNLPRTGERQQISGVVGKDKVPVVRLRDWRAGSVRLDTARATAVDFGGTAFRSEGVRGLLGSDVLSDFGSITLDYRHQVLRLPPAS
ncbi:retropepsin-like aspartic protease [Streptomyces sediminimaris]|uniref:retropepsin-like aspartic protease n=1 Tax=Streptomyces sediminimaris TaxID=3383721 RepID=UPI00399B3596